MLHQLRKYSLLTLLTLSSFILSAQITVDFSVDTSKGCTPLIANFNPIVTGNIVSYKWDFGNGNKSTLSNPVVSYSVPGKYTVKLTVSDGVNSKTISKTDYIEVHDKPLVDFSISASMGCAPLNISFTPSIISSSTISTYYYDFGDGSYSSAKSPSYTYNNAGKYDVTLLVKDVNGCSGALTKSSAVVIGKPTGDFNSDKRFSCLAPQKIDFIAEHLGNGNQYYSYNWDFGDSYSDTGKSVTHTYAAKGLYDVKLTIEDTLGCQKNILKKTFIRIDKIHADFDVIQTDSCVPATITFKNKSVPDSNVVFEWNFYDQTKSSDKDPQKLYAKSGTYSVSLMVYDNSSCSDTVYKKDVITLYPEFKADFSVDTNLFCSYPVKARFTDNSVDVAKRKWTFGNGEVAYSADTTIEFKAFGTYYARLQVENIHGCKLDVKRKTMVKVREPGFLFNPSTYEGCKPLLVSFKVQDTSFVRLTKWKYEFHDKSVKWGKNISYYYMDTGIHRLVTTGSNNRGCKARQINFIKVGTPPHPSFTYDKSIGCFDSMEVHFFNHTNDTTPFAQSFLWDFGDGMLVKGKNPLHRYEDTGSFRVVLHAYNNGCADSVKSKTKIKILPPVVKLPEDKTVCKNQQVQLTHSSIGGHFFIWDFGDGDTSHSQQPIHRYAKSGIYTVKLMVIDTHYNCRHQDSMYVTVSQLPNIKMTSNNHTGCAPLRVNFSDATSNSEFRYWEFGKNKYSYKANPVITFDKPGVFDVHLEVTDSLGCMNSRDYPGYVKVSEIKPSMDLSPTRGCLPHTVILKDKSKSIFPVDYRKWTISNGAQLKTQQPDTAYTFTSLTNGYNQNDGYLVTLEIADTIGCQYSISQKVFPTKPEPQFIDSTNLSCGKREIQFHTIINDTLVKKPYQLTWRFGGTELHDFQFTRTFTKDTSFSVSLELIDGNGCTETVTKNFYVNTQKPKAGLMADSATYGCPPLIVRFKDTTQIGGFGIKNYYWYFGQGSYANMPNPSKIYTQPGKYNVALVVEDSAGCKDSVNYPAFVNIHGLSGSFAYNDLKGCMPYPVDFKGTASDSATYIWYFGDGTIGLGQKIKHHYEHPGFYKPTLVLRDSFGCDVRISGTDSIEVYAIPDVNFMSPKRYYCPAEFVKLFNLTQHDTSIVKWKWQVGSNHKYTTYQPSFSNFDTGFYDVRLIATDTLGCRDTLIKSDYLHIYQDSILPNAPELLSVSTLWPDSLTFIHKAPLDSDFYAFTLIQKDEFNNLIPLFTDTFRFDTVHTLFSTYKNASRCFLIATQDICGNVKLSDSVHCLSELSLLATEEGNILNWSSYTGWSKTASFELFKHVEGIPGFTSMTQVNGQTFSFLDTMAQCGKKYTYQVKAVHQDGKLFSFGNQSDIVSIKKPYMDRIYINQVSVEDTLVWLKWTPSNTLLDHEYIIYRSNDNFVFDEIARIDSTQNEYFDSNLYLDKYAYYYRIKLHELNCDYLSRESNLAKTILLNTRANLGDRNIMELNWDEYQKWHNGVYDYSVEYFDQDAGDFVGLESLDNQFEYIYDVRDIPKLEHCFRITAHENGTEAYSHSNTDCDLGPSKLYIPNAFTPNGDGRNEEFKISCSGCEVESFLIFDRWGQIIFEGFSKDDGWDGLINGTEAPAGVYLYQVVILSHDNPPLRRNGAVTLIR